VEVVSSFRTGHELPGLALQDNVSSPPSRSAEGLVKASRVTTIDGPEGQDELCGRASCTSRIRDEDVLNALEKIAVEFREIVFTSGCRGVLLQGDCGNVGKSRWNGYVEIESRKKSCLRARVSGSSPLVWYQPAHEAGWCGGNGMNTLSFDSKRCGRIRQQLDSYLSNELLVETASEVARHLESCEACSRDFESRMRVRDVLQRAVANRPMPGIHACKYLRTLRDFSASFSLGVAVKRWSLGLAAAAVVLFWYSQRNG